MAQTSTIVALFMAPVIQVVSALYPFGTPSSSGGDGRSRRHSVYSCICFSNDLCFFCFNILQQIYVTTCLIVWDSHKYKLQLRKVQRSKSSFGTVAKWKRHRDISLAISTNNYNGEIRSQRWRCIFFFQRLQWQKSIQVYLLQKYVDFVCSVCYKTRVAASVDFVCSVFYKMRVAFSVDFVC